jgi:lipopolysaccharide/colanic/teichoic acid biosynthesis glycosyltransferase
MPGITGWAQVNQSYDTCVDDVRRKVQFDLEYLRTRSVVRDLAIMARTIPIMLLCRLGW